MAEKTYKSIDLDVCPSCFGIWFDTEELHDLCSRFYKEAEAEYQHIRALKKKSSIDTSELKELGAWLGIEAIMWAIIWLISL